MIYDFNWKDSLAINTVGGKAKALMETTRAGFPVPEGFVISVEFFQEWIDEIKKTQEWKNLLGGISLDNCTRIKEIAGSMKYSKRQKDILIEHISNLRGKIFAVRSSSPEEDLDGTSFAGMYETFLGVDKSSIQEYVKRAFVSCFDHRVMEYKKQNGITIENTSIAVVVQKQIKSQISGVGFSINPINNAYDEVFINAAFGLGEAIVSGLVSPDTYVYDWYKKKIVQKKICDKGTSLWIGEDGGVQEREDGKIDTQALSDEQIVQVSKLIKECEKFYGKPIDTEWAYEDGKLYLLQSRPITTYVPLFKELLTEPGEDKLLYLDILTITQGFSSQLSVLGTEIWGRIMMTSGGGSLSVTADGTSPIIHGRQYFNIFYLYKSLGRAIGNSYIYNHGESVKKMLADIDHSEFTVREYPDAIKGRRFAMMKMAGKFAGPTIKSLFGSYEKQVNDYLELFNNAVKRAEGYSSESIFKDTVQSALGDISEVIFSSGLLMAGVIASNKLKKMFRNHEVEPELASLGMNLQGNPTSEMGEIMFKLASSSEFQCTENREEFLNKIENEQYSNDFMKMFKGFIKKHGVRGFKEIDIASKRLHDDFSELYDRLKDINIEDSQITKVAQKKAAAYEKLHRIAKESGFHKKFEKQVEIYQATFGYREYLKFSSVTFIAKLRKVVLEIAQQFVNQGRIKDAEEIFDLHIEEISKAQVDEKLNLQELREANLKPYRETAHIKDWPIMIDSRGKIYKSKLEVKDGDLVGVTIASGKIRGKAKVMNFPYEKGLEPGEILVIKSAEPSWTPIFINAAGVVMEIGGPLQHGGIIAREYGIPCVSGLTGIMDMVEDGDLIEVNGTDGVVRLIDKDK